jgi:hypothetical protein
MMFRSSPQARPGQDRSGFRAAQLELAKLNAVGKDLGSIASDSVEGT